MGNGIIHVECLVHTYIFWHCYSSTFEFVVQHESNHDMLGLDR